MASPDPEHPPALHDREPPGPADDSHRGGQPCLVACAGKCQGFAEGSSTSSQLAVSFLLHFKVLLMGAEPRIFYTEERALEQKSGPMPLTHCMALGLALLFLSL